MPERAPLLVTHDGFRRLLMRFLDPDPRRRFISAGEAALQAEGVLRQEIARRDGVPCPGTSTVFGPEIAVAGSNPAAFPAVGVEELALALPNLQPDPSDPHAGLLATLGPMAPLDVRRTLSTLNRPTSESRRRAAYAGVLMGGAERANGRHELERLRRERPGDPRVLYACGLAALVDDEPREALPFFEAVRDTWPGELAPRLAIGACHEALGDPGGASVHYEGTWSTDPAWVGAAFGLARCRVALDDRAGAARTLWSVPPTSRAATDAYVCAILAGVGDGDARRAPIPDFFAGAEELDRPDGVLVGLDERRRAQTRAAALERAVRWVEAGAEWPAGRGPRPATLLGHPLTARALRDALESAHRELGALDPARRTEHVDRANRWRNRSWW